MKINTEVLNKNLVNDRMSFKLIFLISYVVIFGVALLTIALPASQKKLAVWKLRQRIIF